MMITTFTTRFMARSTRPVAQTLRRTHSSHLGIPYRMSCRKPDKNLTMKPRASSSEHSSHDTRQISLGAEQHQLTKERLDEMRSAVKTLLKCIGEDPDREGLQCTPERYAKALLFLTKGYHVKPDDFVNNALFDEGHGEMVIVKDIELHSLCEHHLLPFTGKMHIGYLPSKVVIGLSKLPRIAEMFARRLQIQERLTKNVASAVMEILKPQGVIVVMEACHMCMVMRGVEKTGSSTITSCVLGRFEKEPELRKEFWSVIGRQGA